MRRTKSATVLLVLAELFPDSYLVFDSLGEVFRRKGDTEKAVLNFKRSPELNPENKNAAEQLRSLQEKIQ